MPINFVVLTTQIAKDWDELVRNSPDGWVFSYSNWLNMVTEVWSECWEIRNLSFAVEENGHLVAVMPLHYIPSDKRLSSSGWGSAGPIIRVGISESDRHRIWKVVLEHVYQIAAELGADYLNIPIPALNRSSLENRWGVNPLIPFGFTDTSTHTRIIDLTQTETELWFQLSENARRQIKKAKKLGYRAFKRPWIEMVEDYYRVHVETYQRTGVQPHPKAYFEGIARLTEKQNSTLWVGYDPQGNSVAFFNTACFGKTALYHTGCSKTIHLKSGINYLIAWEAILDAKLAGCEWYEIGEAFPAAQMGKERGLTEFKGKFGGELHRYYRGEMVFTQPQSISPTVSMSEPQPVYTFRELVINWLHASKDIFARLLGHRIISLF